VRGMFKSTQKQAESTQVINDSGWVNADESDGASDAAINNAD